MKITQVALRATEASREAGRPELTPELLAATGARYSRSDEGLEAILAKIDPENPDKSVDSIFRMVDYGHASIADMAPVAMFIDGISIWLAYHVWSLVPTAGGQESSTRYIKMGIDGLIPPDQLGIPSSRHFEWNWLMEKAFDAYHDALTFWEKLAAENPEITRIPKSLLESADEKDQKKVVRMKRNYAFDRARYFLPVAAATNMMLVMSARGWVQLCQHLLSHPLPEPRALGTAIREELALVAPRMLKHAEPKSSFNQGIEQEFERLVAGARIQQDLYGALPGGLPDAEPKPRLEVMPPPNYVSGNLTGALQFHDNRYAWTGSSLARTMVRFGWDAVAFAEIRDLNRHRTGTKYCPLRPVGFYSAMDEVPPNVNDEAMAILSEVGWKASKQALALLVEDEPSYIYWTLLGTQYRFEHLTTADKFIYEAEIRTGVGAHYRYAKHLRDVLKRWYLHFPETRGLILEGSAEPE